jgi:hypothetical protein
MTTEGPREGVFGRREFQLVLLRRMADHRPELVDAARAQLDVSPAVMRDANRRWQAMVRGPRARGALARYRSVLGTPELTATRTVGDLRCDVLQWQMPLWPGLRFEIMVAPGGAVWNEWLVRAPGARGPELRTAADLRPWACTVDEVARAFPPARPLEGSAPTRFGLSFEALPEPGSDVPARHVAEFTWGLLQRWERTSPPPAA